MLIWLNGNFINESDATVSIRDTGLLHGAGVFTTMRAAGGQVFRMEQHLHRIRASCEALFIPLQVTDEVLAEAAQALLQRNSLVDARLRITVTRGTSSDDPIHGTRLQPTVLCTATTFEPYPAEYYQRGMTAIVLDEQKLNPYDVQAGHKTLNYFSRLSAIRAANQRRAGEAFWFNVHNYLQSGSISNVLIVKDGTLITPPTQREMQEPAMRDAIPYPRSNVLPGITRAVVLELAEKLRIPVRLSAITIEQLLAADEVLTTNSIMGIMPICRIERQVIGTDKPGPITQQISGDYAALLAKG